MSERRVDSERPSTSWTPHVIAFLIGLGFAIGGLFVGFVLESFANCMSSSPVEMQYDITFAFFRWGALIGAFFVLLGSGIVWTVRRAKRNATERKGVEAFKQRMNVEAGEKVKQDLADL